MDTRTRTQILDVVVRILQRAYTVREGMKPRPAIKKKIAGQRV